ncbi:hypothetical protein TanjilG_09937 [Lupinus angustifolius]|uniref:DRBM domain-containing protein n=1 Tax=Lupinus angustifolius TaxID=3871 RepID=A0A1J7HA17_LUPAN|nr:hypothetical protein TanjilG_09937 [Lupinus angustifolius]
MEGPHHEIRFKCKVTLDGKTYHSPEYFRTLKDAENAAARVALTSLAPNGDHEDNTIFYKNLLQDLLFKEGRRHPVYLTQLSGAAHKPVFLSNVYCGGEHFTGEEAKTKKQAEMSAAKVAYTNLKQRKR